MAVKINFTTKMGVAGGYINFDPPAFLTKTKVQLKMNFWKDLETRNTVGALPFNDQLAGKQDKRINGFKGIYQFDYDMASPLNPFQQGYEYLKTLPEFADATDDVTEEQTAQLDMVQTAAVSMKTQMNNTIKKVGL